MSVSFVYWWKNIFLERENKINNMTICTKHILFVCDSNQFVDIRFKCSPGNYIISNFDYVRIIVAVNVIGIHFKLSTKLFQNMHVEHVRWNPAGYFHSDRVPRYALCLQKISFLWHSLSRNRADFKRRWRQLFAAHQDNWTSKMNHFGGCLGIYCGRTFINQTLGECGVSASFWEYSCVYDSKFLGMLSRVEIKLSTNLRPLSWRFTVLWLVVFVLHGTCVRNHSVLLHRQVYPLQQVQLPDMYTPFVDNLWSFDFCIALHRLLHFWLEFFTENMWREKVLRLVHFVLQSRFSTQLHSRGSLSTILNRLCFLHDFTVLGVDSTFLLTTNTVCHLLDHFVQAGQTDLCIQRTIAPGEQCLR